MLSSIKLKKCRQEADMTVADLAAAMVPTSGMSKEKAQVELKKMRSDIKNWENGLLKSKGIFKSRSNRERVEALANALSVDPQDLECWTASHKFCPMAPRKVRLVADLIRDRDVQDALDVLKFANKRAAVFVGQVLKSAIGSAAENEVEVDQLYVSEIRVDEGGIRRGTRRWRPKDRGRAVPFTKLASHIHISVDVEE